MRGAAIAVVALALACALGPPLLGLDPLAIDAGARLEGPSAAHWLGTDALGRDVLARLLVGGRVSLAVAAAAAAVAVGVGGLLGLLAGYLGGVVDAAVMRATELCLAIPKLPLLIVLTAVVPSGGDGPWGAVGGLAALIAAFGWMTAARLARAAVLPLRRADFVLAARGFGAGTPHVVRAHLWPHARGPLLVAASADLGEFIVYESVLSFLGLGVPPPYPSWGAMLAEAFVHLERAPVLVIAPGLVTFVAVLAFQRLGDDLAAGGPQGSRPSDNSG